MAKLNVDPVAPSNATPPLLHWYANGAVPTAVTLNSTVSPSTADNDPLTSVITGGDSTVSVTTSLSTLPAALVTVTL